MPFKTKWDAALAKKAPVVLKKKTPSTPRVVPPVVAKPVAKPVEVKAPPEKKKGDNVTLSEAMKGNQNAKREKNSPDTISSVKPPTPPDFVGPPKKQFQQVARREVFDRISARWPQVFPRDREIPVRPWAIGIDKDIIAAMPDIPATIVHGALAIFHALCGWEYLDAVIAGGPRYDLDGNPRGEVTAEEQEIAAQQLAARIAKWKEKKRHRQRKEPLCKAS